MCKYWKFKIEYITQVVLYLLDTFIVIIVVAVVIIVVEVGIEKGIKHKRLLK